MHQSNNRLYAFFWKIRNISPHFHHAVRTQRPNVYDDACDAYSEGRVGRYKYLYAEDFKVTSFKFSENALQLKLAFCDC